jgi:RNA-binding protein 39
MYVCTFVFVCDVCCNCLLFVGIKVPVPQAIPTAMMPGALQPAAQAVPPVAGTPSTCILICNMFDPATESGENWDEEIREDVLEECSKHGQVEHIKVEKVRPGGLVFVRFSAIGAASKAANTLNGRFFAGRTIISTFLELGIYEDMAK